VGAPDGLDQEAVVRVAGDDGGAVLAALEHRCARVEAKVAALLLRPVALEAGAD
jgi:hypothetical protein